MNDEQPNWVHDRYEELSQKYNHQTGFVLLAEMLGLILDYLETSDQAAVKQISGLVAQAGKRDVEKPEPVSVEYPVVLEQTGEGQYRFSTNELQRRADQIGG